MPTVFRALSQRLRGNRNRRIISDEETLRTQDEDLQAEAILHADTIPGEVRCPLFGHGGIREQSQPFEFVPLKMGGKGRTHVVSEGSKRLIEEEVTIDDLLKFTNLFYVKAFQDKTLDKFIRSHDDPHAERFAKWIHQKLSGSTLWDHDRKTRRLEPQFLGGRVHVVHDRSSAHAAAWHSPKRPEQEQGRHFQLDECRVWMRLHFWALRESGMLQVSPSFCDYYVRFIGHFVNVYESTAPMFARESFCWSASPANIQAYLENGREMKDVLGLTLQQAMNQLPKKHAKNVAAYIEKGQQINDLEGFTKVEVDRESASDDPTGGKDDELWPYNSKPQGGAASAHK